MIIDFYEQGTVSDRDYGYTMTVNKNHVHISGGTWDELELTIKVPDDIVGSKYTSYDDFMNGRLLSIIEWMESKDMCYREPIQDIFMEDGSEPDEKTTIELLMFNIGNDDRVGFVVDGNEIISPYMLDIELLGQ